MSEQGPFFARLGRFLRRQQANPDTLPLENHPADDQPLQKVTTSRLPFWRPWARRDAAITNLQQGFTSINQLMSAIHQSLDKQTLRQEEMVSHLAQLPELLQSLPDAQKVHAETLNAIGQQLQQQVAQQEQLTEILTKLSETPDPPPALEGLQEQIGGLGEHNQAIAENLRQVSSAMENMGRTTQSSTDVLQQLHEQINAHNHQIDQALQQQTARFTLLMGIAAGLSLIALLAVIIGGIIIVQRSGPATAAPGVAPSPTTLPTPTTAPAATTEKMDRG